MSLFPVLRDDASESKSSTELNGLLPDKIYEVGDSSSVAPHGAPHSQVGAQWLRCSSYAEEPAESTSHSLPVNLPGERTRRHEVVFDDDSSSSSADSDGLTVTSQRLGRKQKHTNKRKKKKH